MKNSLQFQFPDSVIHQAKCEAMASTSTNNIRSKDHLRDFLENRFFHSSKKQPRNDPKSAPTTPAIEVSKDELSTWFKKLTMNIVSSNSQLTENGTGSNGDNNNKKSGGNCMKKSSNGGNCINSGNKKNQIQSSYDNLKNKSRNLFVRKERATSVGPLSRSKSSLWKQPSSKHDTCDNGEPLYQNFSPHRSRNENSSSLDNYSIAQQSRLYCNQEAKRASFPQSKSMMNFSKSYHDLRNEQILNQTDSNQQQKSSKDFNQQQQSLKDFNQQQKSLKDFNQQQQSLKSSKKKMKNFLTSSNYHNNDHKMSSLTPNHVPSCSSSYAGGRKSSCGGSVNHLAPKPIAMSLLDFVANQLQSERIDLTEEPYTDQLGFCGIPPALVQRYAEETGRDLYEVADALDHIRLTSLHVKGRRGIPNDFLADSCSGVVLEQANCENLTVWLTSLGLPMYHQHLVTNGWNNLQSVSRMKEGDLLSAGILDKRHLRSMIRAISALNVTIQKMSSCYEHNYESILSSASTHSSSSSSSTVSQSSNFS